MRERMAPLRRARWGRRRRVGSILLIAGGGEIAGAPQSATAWGGAGRWCTSVRAQVEEGEGAEVLFVFVWPIC